MPIKGPSKTTKKRTCRLFHKNSSYWDRTWTDVEQGEYSLSDHAISKKLTHLFRHDNQIHQEGDGAVESLRIEDHLRKSVPHSPHWSNSKWKTCLAGGKKKTRKDVSTVLILSLQGHSRRNFVDAAPQDIYHLGCARSLHSIINS